MRLLILLGLLISVHQVKAQSGCTDPLASNYDMAATVNNGSCVYPAASVTPYNVISLSDTLEETSGLVYYDNLLWTHNDNSDNHIYAVDTATAKIQQMVTVSNGMNYDWEELSQDSGYFYIGDFGNNGNGNRTDLHILRIAKSALTAGSVIADTIRFSYADQTDFTPAGANNTDFDCEAFIVTDDSIYLFTKQWVGKKTCVYVLPKTPSSVVYNAPLRYTYDVKGLITGATYIRDKKMIVLTGYNTNLSTNLSPFVYLLYDYAGNEFFSGNKRKIDIIQPFSQIEAISTADGKSFFLTNEKLGNSLITIPARLQKIDLTQFVASYYQTDLTGHVQMEKLMVYPNPAGRFLTVEWLSDEPAGGTLQLVDAAGKICFRQSVSVHSGRNRWTITPDVAAGVYQLLIDNGKASLSKMVSFQ